ncbi:MAG TPA: beta-propeller domain-containing protein [Bacilli bacterium]|jgi:uncharacterized secreted protein with C-terminal beta-propeller domain|nr:beta-propeller domain-containing protein [Bacilli bacterium]HOH58787.1 beta-propeller domain-containing protein [Bacilli bacterium]HPA99082.1 beta-propeller domain-containing protein [Bacilli bacterium]HPX83304.1 beta-propeller domain-containing protein [Bacilli bacterium]HQM17949.1 beta-propeller domain-containing protein [Bacilli bacterium]
MRLDEKIRNSKNAIPEMENDLRKQIYSASIEPKKTSRFKFRFAYMSFVALLLLGLGIFIGLSVNTLRPSQYSNDSQTFRTDMEVQDFLNQEPKASGMDISLEDLFRFSGFSYSEAKDGSPETNGPTSTDETNPGGTSGANVQVKGVDEADYLKYDANKLYYVHPNVMIDGKSRTAFEIWKLNEGFTGLLGYYLVDEGYAFTALVANNTHVVVVNYNTGYYGYYRYYEAENKYLDNIEILIFEKEKIKIDADGILEPNKRIIMPGFLTLSSDQKYLRLTDKALLINSTSYIRDGNVPQLSYEFDDRKEEITKDQISYYKDSYNRLFNIFMKVSLEDDYKINTYHWFGSSPTVYVSHTAFYYTERTYNYTNTTGADYTSKTRITKLDFSGDEIVVKGNVLVDGIVRNQWYMDEFEGRLRIVAADPNISGWWSDREKPTKHAVYVVQEKELEKGLEIVGSLTEGIGLPGEDIKSVRFNTNAETGLNVLNIVTYRNTDPLYKILFRDEIKPYIEAELKVPGFSFYLHPITIEEKQLLLGIGIGEEWSDKISLYNNDDELTQIGKDFLINEEVARYLGSDDIYAWNSTRSHLEYIDVFGFSEGHLFGMPIEVYSQETSEEEVKWAYYKSYMMLCINPDATSPIEIWKVFEGDKIVASGYYNLNDYHNYRVIFANGYFYGVGQNVIGLN